MTKIRKREFFNQSTTLVSNGENLKPCDGNSKKTLELVKDMISIAEKGDADREDDG